MKTLEFRPGIFARVPEPSDIDAVAVGQLAPDCFGKLSKVTSVFHHEPGSHVCYYTHMGEGDPKPGCGCSMSMKAGTLIRTVALTGVLNSIQCDNLEREMTS